MKLRNPKRLLIAMSIGDGKTRWETFQSMMSLFGNSAPGWEVEIIHSGGCDVCHSRNLAFHHFRTRSTAGQILFIDSDVRFTPDHVRAIMAHFERDLDFIAGRYPLKGPKLRWSYNRPTEHESGLLNCFEVCTGFMGLSWDLVDSLHRREDEFILEDTIFSGELGYEICKMCVIDKRRYSEDFYLSKRIREGGTPLLVDPAIEVGHIGSVDLLQIWKA